MNEQQYKLARWAAVAFFKKEDDGPGFDLNKALSIAGQVAADPAAFIQMSIANGRADWKAKDDVEAFKAALKKHGRTTDSAHIAAPTHQPIVTTLPFIRCGMFAPDRQPGSILNPGAAEFKAVCYHDNGALIPAQHPTNLYDGNFLVKTGDAERVTATDGSKWLRLTPQFFEKHGYEFTTDGKQVKPTRATLTAWLKRRTTPEQRRKGTVIHGDGFNGVTDELLRQGLAEADGLNQVKVSAEQFHSLGLTDTLEATA